jgi:hypothetical protein
MPRKREAMGRTGRYDRDLSVDGARGGSSTISWLHTGRLGKRCFALITSHWTIPRHITAST